MPASQAETSPAGRAAAVVPAGAPTRADAEAAASVLIAAGVAEVLLFGSVARGDATADSDIDLVAIFADLHYAERDAWRWALEAEATTAAGVPVQVHVTDPPEWRWLTRRVCSSFEASVAPEAVRLVDRDVGEVRWDKEHGLVKTNDEEALNHLNDACEHFIAMRSDLGPERDAIWMGQSLSPGEVVAAEGVHIRWLCVAAAGAIASTVKALRAAASGAGPVGSAGDPTANWSEARRAVLGVLRDRPRGIPERGIAVLLELSEHRVRQDLEALADQGFARCANEHVTWGCDLIEVLLWHIDLTQQCVEALAFLPPRRPREEVSCPTRVPAEFWPMFWSGSRGSDAVLPRDSFNVACELLDCPDRAAQTWALRYLPLDVLERCRGIRGYDSGEIASALDGAIALRQQATDGVFDYVKARAAALREFLYHEILDTGDPAGTEARDRPDKAGLCKKYKHALKGDDVPEGSGPPFGGK